MTAILGRFYAEVAHLQLMGRALRIHGPFWSQRCHSPLAASATFVTVSYPFPSKPSNFHVLLDSNCQHHPFITPLGSFELAVGPYCHHGLQWLRRTVRSTWCALDGHFYSQVAQQPLNPGLSGVGLASPPI